MLQAISDLIFCKIFCFDSSRFAKTFDVLLWQFSLTLQWNELIVDFHAELPNYTSKMCQFLKNPLILLQKVKIHYFRHCFLSIIMYIYCQSRVSNFSTNTLWKYCTYLIFSLYFSHFLSVLLHHCNNYVYCIQTDWP